MFNNIEMFHYMRNDQIETIYDDMMQLFRDKNEILSTNRDTVKHVTSQWLTSTLLHHLQIL